MAGARPWGPGTIAHVVVPSQRCRPATGGVIVAAAGPAPRRASGTTGRSKIAVTSPLSGTSVLPGAGSSRSTCSDARGAVPARASGITSTISKTPRNAGANAFMSPSPRAYRV